MSTTQIQEELRFYYELLKSCSAFFLTGVGAIVTSIFKDNKYAVLLITASFFTLLTMILILAIIVYCDRLLNLIDE